MASDTPSNAGAGEIERFMVADHGRLDSLLAACGEDDGSVDADAYASFRLNLLRHIAVEEKILTSYALAKRVDGGLPPAASLRADHSAIAEMLLHSPTPSLLTSLRTLLERHRALEEGPRCFYATCDDLAGREATTLVERLRDLPEVTVAVGDGRDPRHAPTAGAARRSSGPAVEIARPLLSMSAAGRGRLR
jgi:hypothetical protein